MANVYAVKSGSWSDVSLWNTGALPTSADDVYSNTFTVTVDINATVLSVRNTSATGITAGGGFVAVNGITLNATSSGFVASGSLTLISFTLSSPESATFVGNFSLPNVGNIINSGSGTLNIQGNVTNTSNFGNNSSGSVRNSSSGIINIIGNITPNPGSFSGSFIVNATSGTINITGIVYGPQNNGFYTVQQQGNGSIIIVGSAFGASGNSVSSVITASVLNSGSGTVIFTGTCTGGTASSNAPALINSGSGSITHIGTAIAQPNSVAIYSTNGVCYLTGPFIGTQQGLVANNAFSWRWIQSVGSSYMTVPNSTATGYKNLYTADDTSSSSGQPGISSVRLGTVYGPNSEFTGTLAMPLPSQVYFGVAVDNTTGTAALNVADIWNYPLSGITTSGSIGERLKTSATVNTVSKQISDAFSSR